MSGIGKIGQVIRKEFKGFRSGVGGYFKDAKVRNSSKAPATNKASSPQASGQAHSSSQAQTSSQAQGDVAARLSSQQAPAPQTEPATLTNSAQAAFIDNALETSVDEEQSDGEQELSDATSVHAQSEQEQIDESLQVLDTVIDDAQKEIELEQEQEASAILDDVIGEAESEVAKAQMIQAKADKAFDDQVLSLISSITDMQSKDQVLDYFNGEEAKLLQKVSDVAVEESKNERLRGDAAIADLLLTFSEEVKKLAD